MATYEMLWDCSSCGTKKLLGKSHRRCPNCGAPQDPATRYFPAPGEEVAVEGHVFVGVDWRCNACETPNSRAAAFCVHCGNPQAGNADVARRADQIVKDGRVTEGVDGNEPAPRMAAVRPKVTTVARKRRWRKIAALMFMTAVAFLLITIFWQKDVRVAVERHSWTREIDVEQMAPRADSAWCSSMPSDAYGVSRRREVRSHEHIPDGEDCRDRRTDNGDGTFSTSTVCKTRTRSEPVYDDKCYYTVNRWGLDRTERMQGEGLLPVWPSFRVSGGNCLGCTREGTRREDLQLRVRATRGAEKGKTWDCSLESARWQGFHDGAETSMRVRIITGGAVCASLRPGHAT